MSDPQKEAPRPGGVTPAQVQQMGKTVVGQLYMVLRTVKIHDSFNQAMLLSTENLKDQLNLAWSALGGIVKLEFIDDQVYLNDARIRLDAQSLDNVKHLARQFRSRGLGGLTFKKRVTTDGIRALIKLFTEARPNDAESSAALKEQMGALRDLAMEVLGPRSFAAAREAGPTLEVDPRLWALQTYAKAVMAVKRFVQEAETESAVDPRLKLTRIVQDLVDISSGQASLLLRMCAIKDSTDYVYNHAVNCAVLAVGLGQALGLARLDLVDLGTAAMCADLGFAQGDLANIMTKKELTLEDRVALSQHGLRAVQFLLGKGTLTRSSMRRIVTAFQHHVFHDRQGGYPMSQRRHPLHLFSRITTIVDCFDALTTNRPWREAFPPAEALQMMSREAGTKFDPLLLGVFINLLGIYPLGSRVRLNTGEVAEIYHMPAEPELYQYPVVKILVDAQGSPIEGRSVVKDLADWGTALQPSVWIEGTAR